MLIPADVIVAAIKTTASRIPANTIDFLASSTRTQLGLSHHQLVSFQPSHFGRQGCTTSTWLIGSDGSSMVLIVTNRVTAMLAKMSRIVVESLILVVIDSRQSCQEVLTESIIHTGNASCRPEGWNKR